MAASLPPEMPVGPGRMGEDEEARKRESRAYLLADPAGWLRDSLPEWPFVSMAQRGTGLNRQWMGKTADGAEIDMGTVSELRDLRKTKDRLAVFLQVFIPEIIKKPSWEDWFFRAIVLSASPAEDIGDSSEDALRELIQECLIAKNTGILVDPENMEDKAMMIKLFKNVKELPLTAVTEGRVALQPKALVIYSRNIWGTPIPRVDVIRSLRGLGFSQEQWGCREEGRALTCRFWMSPSEFVAL